VGRPVASTAPNVVPMRRPRRVSAWPSLSVVVFMRAMHVLAQLICRTELL
jgi:hypothetical protein